ncbi:LCOR protein, partial [Polypterus senegalus]
MIRQFAAEYTSKTSSPQDSIQPNGTKDQSLPKTSSFAPAENPVLSKLLMADQDSPLDLTVKKVETESSDQGRADHSYRDGHSQDADGLSQRSLQDGMREGYSHSSPIKPPLARSLQIKEELQSRKQQLQQPPVSLANLESMGMVNHRQQLSVSRESSWNKPHFDNHLKFRGNSAINELKDLPFLLENSCAYPKVPAQLKIQEGKRDSAYSAPVDLKIPQVRGMDLSWDSHGSDLYGYGSLVVGSHSENALNKKLRAILPKQNRRGGRGRGILDGGPDFWGSDAEQSTSGQQYPTSDHEGDPNSKQPRKKRGRYRQYNSEILEEAISVVMSGKMSVSKAQNIYGIPHSTLEYKVKERLGTLKNPPKKKMKLMRMEGQEVVAESDPSPRGEGSQGINDSKDD